MRKIITFLALIFIAVQNSIAQCAMCKASAETSMESSTQAAGINTGVLYALFFVFIILIFFVILFFKGANKES